MTTTPTQTISLVAARYPHTEALVQADTTIGAGLTVHPVTVEPIVAAYRREIRTLEFDVCEMAISTYLVARDHGVRLTALPIPLNRRFHHRDVICRTDSGIESPRDLEGRRIGVRAYSVTSGVWARQVLAEQFDVDIDRITWVVDDEEHVQQLALPGNVVHAPAGRSLAELFADGDVEAAFGGWAGIGRSGRPESWDAHASSPTETGYPLLAEPGQHEHAWYDRTGVLPIHGVLAVREDTLARTPHLADALWDAFSAERPALLAQMADPQVNDTEVQRYRDIAAVVGPDPLPYGLDANRASLEAAIRACVDQHLLRSAIRPEDAFLSY